MKNFYSLLFVLSSLCFADMYTCGIDPTGCKEYGAVRITREGKNLTNCLWLDDAITQIKDLTSSGMCALTYGTCELETKNCKYQGYAQVFRERQALTDCKQVRHSTIIFQNLYKAHLCYSHATERCDIRPKNCTNNGVRVYIGEKDVSGCELLFQANDLVRFLKEAKACK